MIFVVKNDIHFFGFYWKVEKSSIETVLDIGL